MFIQEIDKIILAHVYSVLDALLMEDFVILYRASLT